MNLDLFSRFFKILLLRILMPRMTRGVVPFIYLSINLSIYLSIPLFLLFIYLSILQPGLTNPDILNTFYGAFNHKKGC